MERSCDVHIVNWTKYDLQGIQFNGYGPRLITGITAANNCYIQHPLLRGHKDVLIENVKECL